MMLRFILSFFLVLLLSSCETPPKEPEPDPIPEYVAVNIYEGVGIRGIVIGQSTKEDVINEFGTGFATLKENSFSSKIKYEKLGVSVSFVNKKDIPLVSTIEVESPYFIGKTSKGIVLGRSTMEDVMKTYGGSRWATIKEESTWCKMYPGIEFHVDAEEGMPRFPLNKAVHRKKTITKMLLHQ